METAFPSSRMKVSALAERPAVAVLPIPVLVRLMAFLRAEDFLVGHRRESLPALEAVASTFILRRPDWLFIRHCFACGSDCERLEDR